MHRSYHDTLLDAEEYSLIPASRVLQREHGEHVILSKRGAHRQAWDEVAGPVADSPALKHRHAHGLGVEGSFHVKNVLSAFLKK